MIALANTIEKDEDLLICDLAETYHILEYKSLPAELVATLFVGLRADSRIKMKARGIRVSDNTLLLSVIADKLIQPFGNRRQETFTENCFRKEKNSEIQQYTSGEEFEKVRNKLIGESNGN